MRKKLADDRQAFFNKTTKYVVLPNNTEEVFHIKSIIYMHKFYQGFNKNLIIHSASIYGYGRILFLSNPHKQREKDK
jgi:hypothetical protein